MARLIDEDEAFKVLSAYYKHRTPAQDSALHDALSRVPSADLVNEWCTDCKEYDQTQHCCHRFTKVIRQAQEELKQNAVPVIRCMDCKHFVLVRGWRYIGEPDYMHCDMFMDSHSPWVGSDYEPSEEDYCSRAERRGEG